MRKFTLLFLYLLTISCNTNSVDYHSYATDKIWIRLNDMRETYLSSKDNTVYLYNGNDVPDIEVTFDDSSWDNIGYFKIENDTFYDLNDFKGKEVYGYELMRLKDTTIGIVNYNTLAVKLDETHQVKFISKIK